jgi:hypothetical protein
MISDVRHEDLGFVFEAAEGAGMQDPVTITLKCEADVRSVNLQAPPSARL